MKLGLGNIRTLLAALGNPQNNYLKVQVAGTNGKGSVCAFLDAICVSAGVRAGLFTSPHLISITERIRINGVDISEADFARHATLVSETGESLLATSELEYRPTFFEQITAIALVAFADAKIELAILETGLGGRLDATTAANAEIVAITPIDIDHQEYLGETLAEIAAEKAAITRERSVVVVSDQRPEADLVISERLDDLGIVAMRTEDVRTSGGRGWLKFHTEHAEYEVETLGLNGRHQIENAKVTILLAQTLRKHFQISTQNIIDGLKNARHPGRLEFSGRYLFDGAHNPAGAEALKEFLDELTTQPITMIFGAMKEKDISAMAEILFPRVETLILTQPENSRAMATVDLAKYADENTKMILTNNVADAVQKAETLSNDNRLILVTGSLYLIGEVKKILNN